MFRVVIPLSSGAHITEITASGTGQTVSATFRCREAADFCKLLVLHVLGGVTTQNM
jgi:hypothetical protein